MSQQTRSIFSGTDVSASGPFFYNSAKETGIDDGWIGAKANHTVVQIGCATAVNTLTYRIENTLTYRIEGRSANGDRSASIAIGTISGTPSIDKYVEISPKFSEIRVGVTSASTVGSPITGTTKHKFYCSAILTETT